MKRPKERIGILSSEMLDLRAKRDRVDSFVGFDSAWTDRPNAPGAIAALRIRGDEVVEFHEPQLVSFEGALRFIAQVKSPAGCTLIALDQPTVVANETGMRPVERAAASLISWLGGGVQPASRSRVGMFCQAAPIWLFLGELKAQENPEVARSISSGLHIIEVFPALALPSLNPAFFGRLAAPRYNPGRRKTFRAGDWVRVANTAADMFQVLGFPGPAQWCQAASQVARPRKADQDRLDSMLCLGIALWWRRQPRSKSLMLGCLGQGYMVTPVVEEVRERLAAAARKSAIVLDGVDPC